MLLTSRSVKKHSTVPLKLLLREGRWGGGGETQFSVKAQKGRERESEHGKGGMEMKIPAFKRQFQSCVCSRQEPWAHKGHFVPAAEAHGIGDGGRMPAARQKGLVWLPRKKAPFGPTLDMHPTQIPPIFSSVH